MGELNTLINIKCLEQCLTHNYEFWISVCHYWCIILSQKFNFRVLELRLSFICPLVPLCWPLSTATGLRTCPQQPGTGRPPPCADCVLARWLPRLCPTRFPQTVAPCAGHAVLVLPCLSTDIWTLGRSGLKLLRSWETNLNPNTCCTTYTSIWLELRLGWGNPHQQDGLQGPTMHGLSHAQSGRGLSPNFL